MLPARPDERAASVHLAAEDAVPLLRQMLDERAVRPAYGGHPRIAILGLLEARLQQADLVILGGMNEGVWPALPQPDPWLAPKIRANLGLPGLEYRLGLAAHDFASLLGAPRALITRARRDSRSPTVASRLLPRRVVLVHLSETGGTAFAASRSDLGLLGLLLVVGIVLVWLVAAAFLAVTPARHLLVPHAAFWKQPANRAEIRRTEFDALSVANAISARGLAGDVYRAATVRTGRLVR